MLSFQCGLVLFKNNINIYRPPTPERVKKIPVVSWPRQSPPVALDAVGLSVERTAVACSCDLPCSSRCSPPHALAAALALAHGRYRTQEAELYAPESYSRNVIEGINFKSGIEIDVTFHMQSSLGLKRSILVVIASSELSMDLYIILLLGVLEARKYHSCSSMILSWFSTCLPTVAIGSSRFRITHLRWDQSIRKQRSFFEIGHSMRMEMDYHLPAILLGFEHARSPLFRVLY